THRQTNADTKKFRRKGSHPAYKKLNDEKIAQTLRTNLRPWLAAPTPPGTNRSIPDSRDSSFAFRPMLPGRQKIINADAPIQTTPLTCCVKQYRTVQPDAQTKL
ncbi:unnamed protein product, partial [Ectocarpus sp. 12 AP-2014]